MHADLGELAQEEPVRLGVAGGREEEGRRPGTRETATRRRAHATHVRLPANDARYDSTASHFNQRAMLSLHRSDSIFAGLLWIRYRNLVLRFWSRDSLRTGGVFLVLVVKQVLLTSPIRFIQAATNLHATSCAGNRKPRPIYNLSTTFR